MQEEVWYSDMMVLRMEIGELIGHGGVKGLKTKRIRERRKKERIMLQLLRSVVRMCVRWRGDFFFWITFLLLETKSLYYSAVCF